MKPVGFRDLRLPRWVERLDEHAQDATVDAVIARRQAVYEGASQYMLAAGDRYLDTIRLERLDGEPARRKALIAERWYGRAYRAAYMKRESCRACGTSVRPGTIHGDNEARCAFCGRSQSKMRQLIGVGGEDSARPSPVLHFCADCIRLAYELAGPRRRKRRVRRAQGRS